MAPRRKRPDKDQAETGQDPQAKTIREKYEKGVNAIRSEIGSYQENSAFLMGDQWLWYNPESMQLDHLPRDPDRAQPVVDRLWPSSRTIISKLLQRELAFEVLPEAADDATRIAAGLAQSRVEELHREHRWEELRERAVWSAWKGGTAGIAIDWDASRGDRVAPNEEGEPGEVRSGETKEEALSITQMVFEAGTEDAEAGAWWIKAKAMPAQSAKEAFSLDYTPAADVTAGSSALTSKLTSSNGISAGPDAPDMCLVLTYYERPSKTNPKGEVTTVIGQRTVDGPKPWPFPFKDHLNVTLIRETLIETKWAGETVLNLARPVQAALNAAWASAIEHMREAGASRLAVPYSSLDIIDQLGDLAGEYLPYPDGQQPPSYLRPGEMSQTTTKLIEMLPLVIDDILGVHQVSRGAAPPNIESGYGLSVLAEQDETPLGRMLKQTADAFSKVASWVLEIEETKVKHTKTSVVRAPGMPAQSTEWTGSDLMGQTDVVVPPGAILPRSRAAMQAFADKAMQMGLITNLQQYSKVADLPDQRELIAAVSPDVDRARRENYMMVQGEVSIVREWDNHQIHLDELNAFRKSAKFETLDLELQKLFEDHAQGHETMAAEEMGRQRAKIGIDPMLASAANKSGAPTVPVEELPPGGGVPADAGLAPGSDGVGPLSDMALRDLAQGSLDTEISLPPQ